MKSSRLDAPVTLNWIGWRRFVRPLHLNEEEKIIFETAISFYQTFHGAFPLFHNSFR